MKKVKHKQMSGWAVALAAALIISLAAVMVIALLISKEVLTVETGKWIALLVGEVVVLVAFCLRVRTLSQNRLPAILILAAAYCALRLAVGTVFFSNAPLEPTMCILTLGGGVVAGMMVCAKKQRRR